jgi:hypothetical protein
MQRVNELILLGAGACAAIGFLAMLLITFFQWRMSKGLAEISAALRAAPGLGAGSAAAALEPVEQSNLPLLGPTEQHESRSHERTRASQTSFKPSKGTGSRSIERLLFPNPGDSFRRRQFRALKTAMIFGLIFAAAVALVLYVLHSGPRAP